LPKAWYYVHVSYISCRIKLHYLPCTGNITGRCCWFTLLRHAWCVSACVIKLFPPDSEHASRSSMFEVQWNWQYHESVAILSWDHNRGVHGKWYAYSSGACPHTILHSRHELPWAWVKLSWGAACLCAEVVRVSLGETNYTELEQNSFRQDFSGPAVALHTWHIVYELVWDKHTWAFMVYGIFPPSAVACLPPQGRLALFPGTP